MKKQWEWENCNYLKNFQLKIIKNSINRFKNNLTEEGLEYFENLIYEEDSDVINIISINIKEDLKINNFKKFNIKLQYEIYRDDNEYRITYINYEDFYLNILIPDIYFKDLNNIKNVPDVNESEFLGV